MKRARRASGARRLPRLLPSPTRASASPSSRGESPFPASVAIHWHVRGPQRRYIADLEGPVAHERSLSSQGLAWLSIKHSRDRAAISSSGTGSFSAIVVRLRGDITSYQALPSRPPCALGRARAFAERPQSPARPGRPPSPSSGYRDVNLRRGRTSSTSLDTDKVGRHTDKLTAGTPSDVLGASSATAKLAAIGDASARPAQPGRPSQADAPRSGGRARGPARSRTR